MSIEQGFALLFVAVALIQARWALKAPPAAAPSVQAERFLDALASALVAVFCLMPALSIGWWCALLAMLGAAFASLRLFIGRQRQLKASRGTS